MEQYLEFIGNNLVLVGIWIALALALIFHRSKTGAQAVGPQQAVMMINRNDAVVLDIRDKKDYDTGHIVDSVHIPHTKLGAQVAGPDKELEKMKSRPIIVVCKMGQHSGDACKILRSAGFEQVVKLRGGMAEWRAQNLPLIQKAEKSKGADKKGADKKAGKKAAKPRPRKGDKATANPAPELAPVADPLAGPAVSASDEAGSVAPEASQPEDGRTAEAPAGQEEVRQDNR
ncbi:rhodanese-like domain-containing protein [Pseudohongiella acticola]|jgi:rhodanese-related sulfurtransferase|uniref:rhodanese-like domain-containing protein n=1 Tax=Pseudohongiella acticola TaxID=1524254 RepID=UPI0030EF9E49